MSDRIAVVFPLPLERQHLGKDVFLIPEGLRRQGFDVELHCTEARGSEWPLPVVEAGRGGLADPRHWRGRSLEGAIVYSFLRHARLLAAVRASGARVVAKGDTTGYVIARQHPRPTLEYALYDPPTVARTIFSIAYWLARVGPLHHREARTLMRGIGAADSTVIETQSARETTARTLARLGASDLAERLVVVPSPVADPFIREHVAGARERLVVAVGRWNLQQKDTPLLVAALKRFLKEHPDYRAVVIGSGGEGVFPVLAGGRLHQAGRLSQQDMVPLFRRARIVVTSSRWESASLSSHEGLAMGCTVAGPVLPPLRDIVSLGPYGTLAERRDARGLASALGTEARAWEEGMRDPAATAAFWRGRLGVDVVARRFAALLDLRGATPAGG